VLGTGTTLTVTLNQAIGLTKLVTATFTGVSTPADNLDIDGNHQVSALTDGVLLVRYLFGVRGAALTQGALGANATRTNATDIVTYLDQAKTTMLDVDGNGTASALTDGVLLVRYLFGVRGNALIQGALAPDANPARNQAIEIEPFIGRYTQLAGTQSAAASSVLSNQQLSGLSTQNPALSVEPSVLSTQNPALDPQDSALSVEPSVLITQDSALPGAVAATQLSNRTVQTAPWVSQFVGSGSIEEEEEMVVLL
jgi:hypothetical protein